MACRYGESNNNNNNNGSKSNSSVFIQHNSTLVISASSSSSASTSSASHPVQSMQCHRAMGRRAATCGVRWRLVTRSAYVVVMLWALVVAVVLYSLAIEALFPGSTIHHRMQPIVMSSSSEFDDDVIVSGQRAEDTEEPLVDRGVPSQDDLFAMLQEKAPNFPIAFCNKYDKLYGNKRAGKCAKLSPLSELEFNNNYWQLLRSSNGTTFAFFGAYLDVRRSDTPLVRVLAMVDRLEPTKPFCQLWFQDTMNPTVTKVTESRFIWEKAWGNNKDGIYQPFLFSCPFPKDKLESPPVAVSIVEKQCDKATNVLRVIYNKPSEKKNIAVCVKGLDYLHVDLSVRLVEWIELLLVLGVDKIFFYKLHIHPNISKVLDYYEKLGKVQVVPITLPAHEPNLPILQHYFLQKKLNHKRQNELIPYNDCLYKNLYSYRYVSLLDIDEVIMPANLSSWVDLISHLETQALARKKKKLASFYVVRNVYFLDDAQHRHSFFRDIPKFMHMMQHVYRSKNFTKPGAYIKGFHSTDSVVSVHNHFPRSCMGPCDLFSVSTNDAQLQHYRSDCVRDLKKSCEEYRKNSVIDTKIWRFKEAMVKRVVNALRTLGFLPSSDQIS